MSIPTTEIRIGGEYYGSHEKVYAGQYVTEFDCVTAVDLIGRELSADELTVTITQPAGDSYDLANLAYGKKIFWFFGSALKGLFFLAKTEQVGPRSFRLICTSRIGLLRSRTFYGLLAEGTTFTSVLTSIFGSSADWTAESALSSQRVYGYLKPGDARDALHKLLTTFGVSATKNATTGKLHFEFIKAGTPTAIASESVYNEGRLEKPDPVSRVDVTYYQYFNSANVEEKLLIDEAEQFNPESRVFVFSEPVVTSSIRTEGQITITERRSTYLVYSGRGRVFGRPYARTSGVVSRSNPSAPYDNAVKLDGVYVVSPLIADNVADRLFEYYTQRKVLDAAVKLNSERCGGLYQFMTALGASATGFLVKMDSKPSSFIRAECEFLTGYTPKALGNAYTTVEVLADSGGWKYWTVPQSVKTGSGRVKIVVIGDGEAGTDGEDGEAGSDATASGPGKGGSGGAAGTGGLGGKILEAVVNVASESSLAYIVSPGYIQINADSRGEHIYNANNGVRNDLGFYDTLHGRVFGARGLDGVPGGDGGDGGSWGPVSATIAATDGGRAGQPGSGFLGGKASGNRFERDYYLNTSKYSASCAGGGGAYNGGDWTLDGEWYLGGGHGAPGADAGPLYPPPETSYGCGGHGGHGGGGGAGGSINVFWNYVNYEITETVYASGGDPGSASAGTTGRRGCILIYHE